ncbi:MAG: hypothetical protein OEW78_04990 [Nitrosopumilus sp.]|uniref:hypothetical protein n=1 Tax=Nitrosopumilus sp. TaxID=2024843 RepID=UPI002472D90F|nr:hypothetical protein [Nitrosopumilus sp.]MDH5431223.1 hypothetical protein [Nitrosopumilus sp.]
MSEWDIPNWITLVVEIAVAIFAIAISLKFYKRGKEQQEKAKKILDRIEEFTKHETELKKDRHKQLFTEFEGIKKFLNQLDEDVYDVPSDKNYIETFKKGKVEIPRLISNYGDLMTFDEKNLFEGLKEHFEDMAERDQISIEQIQPIIHHIDSCYLQPLTEIYSKKFSGDNSSL